MSPIRTRGLLLAGLASLAIAAVAFGAPPAPTDVVAIDRPFDAGKALRLQWKNADDPSRSGYLVFRSLLPEEIKQADRDSRVASATAAADAARTSTFDTLVAEGVAPRTRGCRPNRLRRRPATPRPPRGRPTRRTEATCGGRSSASPIRM